MHPDEVHTDVRLVRRLLADRELRWLPKLAPLLPVAIPVPVAKGLPADGYPWEWGV